MLQHVIVCCSMLQCVAACCSVLQWRSCPAIHTGECLCVLKTCVPVRYSVLKCVAECGSVLQCVAVCCSVLQCVAFGSSGDHALLITQESDRACRNSELQCIAECCSVLQCVASRSDHIKGCSRVLKVGHC